MNPKDRLKMMLHKAKGGGIDPDLAEAKRLGMDTSNISEIREAGKLKTFHSKLSDEISEKMKKNAEVVKQYHESGKIPMPVGTRFMDSHSRKHGMRPLKVIGHFVDSKDPEHYGYHVERGTEGDKDYLRTMMSINHPKRTQQEIKSGREPFDFKKFWDDVQVMGGLTRAKADGGSIHEDPETKTIEDWQWRPLEEVKTKLGDLKEIPSHVRAFGDFMNNTATKAGTVGLTPRDLIKAYTITRASIQRGAVHSDKVRNAGLKLDPAINGPVRPEGAFGEWLHTPMGQRYLKFAEKGQVDPKSIQNAVQIMAPFGRHTTDIPDALIWAAQNIPGREKIVSKLVASAQQGTSTPDEWRDFAEEIRGIGPSKAGFVASLLGRGDQPTLDARQLILHTGQPSKEAGKYIRRKGGMGGREAVDRLAARQKAMGLELPSSLSPYYQHLAHHTVWDAAGNEETTHEDVMNAMRHAAKGGPISQDAMRLALLNRKADGGPARMTNRMGFYSPAAEAAANLPQETGTPEQMAAMLGKARGVSQEMAHSGMPEGNKLSKQQLAEHFQKSMPDLREQVLMNREDGDGDPDEPIAEYGDWTHPGGKNYREILLHVPPKRHIKKSRKVYFTNYDSGERFMEDLKRYEEKGLISGFNPYKHKQPRSGAQRPLSDQLIDMGADIPDAKKPHERQHPLLNLIQKHYGTIVPEKETVDPSFSSSHYDHTPNVVAHLRLKERPTADGGTALHLEELQSDWGQKLRDMGKRGSDKAAAKLNDMKLSDWQKLSPEDKEFTKKETLIDSRIPIDGPYVGNTDHWTDLGLKRALIEAAKNGNTHLVWTPGEDQADRYDLSKQVGKIVWNEKTGDLAAERSGGDTGTIKHSGVTRDKLADIIGKEPARKLAEAKTHGDWRFLEGDDLKVGGEGMRKYYDKDVPERLKRILKDLDPSVKVEHHPIAIGENDNEIRHFPGIRITDKLRAEIKKGLPAFNRGGVIHKATG